MLTGLSGLVFLIAASAAQENGEALAAPPDVREAPGIRAKCTCAASKKDDFLLLQGLVVDAELTVSESGRSANDRQATVFDVSGENEKGVSGRTRVHHSANTDKCGVVFDYGKKYTIAVREDVEGEFETDACLMRDVETPDQ